MSGSKRETENATLLTEDRGRGHKPRDAGGCEKLGKGLGTDSP